MKEDDDKEVKDNIDESFLNKLFDRSGLVLMLLTVVFNLLIGIVLVYYGNMLAFLFIINIYYCINYYRIKRKEKIRIELG